MRIKFLAKATVRHPYGLILSLFVLQVKDGNELEIERGSGCGNKFRDSVYGNV